MDFYASISRPLCFDYRGFCTDIKASGYQNTKCHALKSGYPVTGVLLYLEYDFFVASFVASFESAYFNINT